MTPVVLDTSGILHSDLNFSKGNFIVTSSVLQEVVDETTKIVVNSALDKGDITVRDPGDEFIERVEDAAGETGDLQGLSEPDISVLALALELKATLVSDDYQIQNVADHLNIEYERSVQDGIRERLKWRKVCSGCAREYPLKDDICDVCGSELKKKAVKIN